MKNILVAVTFLIAVCLIQDVVAMDAIQQAAPKVTGFRLESVSASCPFTWSDGTCRTIPEPTDWSGPNLFNPNGWVVTYGERTNCTVVMDNGTLTMTKVEAGWPPCGVMQKFPAAVGARFRIVADVVINTDQSEIYTGAEGSLFLPGTGTRTNIVTSKWADMVVWLQTYSLATLPITTQWKNVVIKKIQ